MSTALRHHLQYNHWPPVVEPQYMDALIILAEQAIEEVACGCDNRPIVFPGGVIPAYQVVDDLRLHWFVDELMHEVAMLMHYEDQEYEV